MERTFREEKKSKEPPQGKKKGKDITAQKRGELVTLMESSTQGEEYVSEEEGARA